MPDYIRSWRPGGTFFFTVNLLERRGNDLLVRHIEALRDAVRVTREERPFEIVAWVVLPDHMHAIWSLPERDSDYATRRTWTRARQRIERDGRTTFGGYWLFALSGPSTAVRTNFSRKSIKSIYVLKRPSRSRLRQKAAGRVDKRREPPRHLKATQRSDVRFRWPVACPPRPPA
jgi:REP element-mobilizing transposase RayT